MWWDKCNQNVMRSVNATHKRSLHSSHYILQHNIGEILFQNGCVTGAMLPLLWLVVAPIYKLLPKSSVVYFRADTGTPDRLYNPAFQHRDPYAATPREILTRWNDHPKGRLTELSCTVYPKKYAHGFVVLRFVVVTQSFIMNSHEVFIHNHQGCFAGTGAIVRLPQCQKSKPDGYGKISQCITTTKHSKAKTVCIFLGIYCTAM